MRHFASLLLLAATLSAQEPLITTVAGTDFVFPARIPALQAPFANIMGLAAAANGDLYLADQRLHQVFRLSTDGVVTAAVGNGIDGLSGNGGPAVNAMIASPSNLAFDRAGNLYVNENGAIWKVDTKGNIAVFAGNGHYGYDGDGKPATAAGIAPGPIFADNVGNIFIVDRYNSRIRVVDPAGIIHTAYLSADDSASQPYLGAVDSKGNIYFKNYAQAVMRIRKDTGAVEIFAGAAEYLGEPFDGADALKVNLDAVGIVVDTDDSIIVATYSKLLRIDQNRRVTLLSSFNGDLSANAPGVATATNGPAALVNFDFELIALDPARNVVVRSYDQRVRRINLSSSTFDLLAGSGLGQFSGDGGPALSANLYRPQSIAPDSAGNLYIADTGNLRLRYLDSRGGIDTVAGNGNGNGQGTFIPSKSAVDAAISPFAVRTDALGRAHMLNSYPSQVLRLDHGGLTNLLDTSLGYYPRSLAIAPGGEIYLSGISQEGNPAYAGFIFRLGPDGKPVPVAGVGEKLLFPGAMALDSDGNVVFMDEGSFRIRRFTPGGAISTIAGGGTTAPGEGVLAINASLPDLSYNALTTDPSGNVYFSYGFGVYRFNRDGILHVVVGESYGLFTGDGGPARLATLSGRPGDLATDPAGNLFIADTGANRIRLVPRNAPGIRVDRATLNFSAAFTGAPSDPQKFKVTADIAGLAFTVDSDTPWLSITPADGASPRLIEVRADPSLVPSPGEFDGRVILHSLNAAQHQVVVPVHFTVKAAQPPRLTVDTDLLSYTYSVNGTARAQLLTLSNTGGGSLAVAVSSSTQTGGGWLHLSAAGGILKPGSPLRILITADPSKLGAGTYRARIVTAGSDGSSGSTIVVMTVSANPKAMLLSQTGLSFLGVAGGGIVPPQSFSVLSLGTSPVSFTAAPSALWLRAQTDSGNAVHVAVDAAGLEPGSYYGQVHIDAPGAANSPQTVTVNFRVLAPDAPPPPAIVQPAELTFMPSSDDAPSSQTLTVYNLGVSPLGFRVGTARGMYVLPRDAFVNPSSPFPVVVQPAYGFGFDPASVSVSFSDGTVAEIPYKVVNAPTVPSARGVFTRRDAGDGCSPQALNISVRYIGQTGFLQGGWPAGMGLQVADDCGNPLTGGAVTAKFSNGDSAVSLTHVGAGIWQGTWSSSPGASHVRIDFHAEDATHLVAADRQYQTDMTSGQMPPSVQTRDVVSYSSPSANTPLAPGALITFTGINLTSGATYEAKSTPLRTSFDGLSVVLRDQRLPLLYASPTRVDAMIPFDILSNAPQQLQIQVNDTQSTPIYINLAPAAPVIVANTDAHAGGTVVFYCIGLGAVDQPVDPGDAAPAVPTARTVNPVTVQLGDTSISTFGVLTPGFVGLYQIAASLPDGVAAGDTLAVTVTVAGQVSPAAYVSVQ